MEEQEKVVSFSRLLRRMDRTLDAAERNALFVAFELLRVRRRFSPMRWARDSTGLLLALFAGTLSVLIGFVNPLLMILAMVIVGMLLWKIMAKRRVTEVVRLPRTLGALLEGTVYPQAIEDLWLTPNSAADFIDALVLERRRGSFFVAAFFSSLLCGGTYFLAFNLLISQADAYRWGSGGILFTVVCFVLLCLVIFCAYWFLAEASAEEVRDSLQMLHSRNRVTTGLGQLAVAGFEGLVFIALLSLLSCAISVPVMVVLNWLLLMLQEQAEHFRSFGGLGVQVTKFLSRNIPWLVGSIGLLPMLFLLWKVGHRLRRRYLLKLETLKAAEGQLLGQVMDRLINGDDP